MELSNRKKITTFLLFLSPFILSSFSVSEIKWDENLSLKWTDFSGKIDTSSEYDAWTWSGFNYTYSWEIVDGRYEVNCHAYAFFDPSKSWVKKNKQSEELLRHEQLHFNISELHCRYFKHRIDNLEFSENVDGEVKEAYDSVFQELLDKQIQYDEETNHCKIKDEQLRWTNFINDELKRLEEYKN